MRRLLGVGTAALLVAPVAFAQSTSTEVSHGVEVIRGGPPPNDDRTALLNDANSLREQVHWLQTQLRAARAACIAPGGTGGSGTGGSGGAGTGGSGTAGIGAPMAAMPNPSPGPKTIDTREVTGRLVWVDPAAIAVQVRNGGVLHLRVDAFTEAQQNGHEVGLAGLAPGESVRAEYMVNAGTQTATRVDVLGRAKTPARTGGAGPASGGSRQ